jgi:hypothetical protein
MIRICDPKEGCGEREAAPDIKGLQGRQLLERRRQGRRALGADAIIAAKERGRGGEGGEDKAL